MNVPKIATANVSILCIYFFAGQICPLHLAKNALGKVENCKAAKCRIALYKTSPSRPFSRLAVAKCLL
jgi:hypothetical protein